jgi:hypothetical protein
MARRWTLTEKARAVRAQAACREIRKGMNPYTALYAVLVPTEAFLEASLDKARKVRPRDFK